MYADDRDLLVLEPSIFTEHFRLGQRLFRGTVSVSGTQVAAVPEVNFAQLGVSVGGVIVIGEGVYEIAGVQGGTRLVVSRPRGTNTDPVIAPPGSASIVASIVTFRPQLSLAERLLIRELGAGADRAKLLSVPLVRDLIVLGALELILATTSTTTPAEESKLEFFRRLLARTRGLSRIELDLDGDGQADAERTFGSMRLERH